MKKNIFLTLILSLILFTNTFAMQEFREGIDELPTSTFSLLWNLFRSKKPTLTEDQIRLNSGDFAQLPDEILSKILENLSICELANISKVCKRFKTSSFSMPIEKNIEYKNFKKILFRKLFQLRERHFSHEEDRLSLFGSLMAFEDYFVHSKIERLISEEINIFFSNLPTQISLIDFLKLFNKELYKKHKNKQFIEDFGPIIMASLFYVVIDLWFVMHHNTPPISHTIIKFSKIYIQFIKSIIDDIFLVDGLDNHCQKILKSLTQS